MKVNHHFLYVTCLNYKTFHKNNEINFTSNMMYLYHIFKHLIIHNFFEFADKTA